MPKPQLRDGFVGQSMYVIPRPVLAEARLHPLVRALYPTDIGWYPNARYHYRYRSKGAEEDHLIVCVDGRGFVEIDGVAHELSAGHLLVIPKECPHKYWATDDAPWSIYWMHYLGDESEYYLERIPGPGVPAAVDAETGEEAVRLFRDCLRALESGYALPGLIYAAQSARHILSLLLFRNPALPTKQANDERLQLLEATIEYMHTNVKSTVRLPELAAQAGHSVSHFSEWFRKETGHSPMAYFIQLKIRYACQLLDLSDQSVMSVALETGYSDPYYFSRIFKKVMGISPEKYRAVKKG